MSDGKGYITITGSGSESPTPPTGPSAVGRTACRPVANEGEARVRGIGWCYEHRHWCGLDAHGNPLPRVPPPRDDSAEVLLHVIRDVLHVPEAASTTEYARLHFARSCWGTEFYNALGGADLAPDDLIPRIVQRAMATFPHSVGEDLRVWDDRPPKLGDVGTEIQRSS